MKIILIKLNNSQDAALVINNRVVASVDISCEEDGSIGNLLSTAKSLAVATNFEFEVIDRHPVPQDEDWSWDEIVDGLKRKLKAGEPNFNDFNQDYRYNVVVETRLVLSLPVTDFRPEAMRVTERKAANGKWFEVETFNAKRNQWIEQQDHPSEAEAITDANGWYPQPAPTSMEDSSTDAACKTPFDIGYFIRCEESNLGLLKSFDLKAGDYDHQRGGVMVEASESAMEKIAEFPEDFKVEDIGYEPKAGGEKFYVGTLMERNGERTYDHQFRFKTSGSPEAYMDKCASNFFEFGKGEKGSQGEKGYYFDAGCLYVEPKKYQEVDAAIYGAMAAFIDWLPAEESQRYKSESPEA